MHDERLKNGARCLATRESALGGKIVLAQWTDAALPYATWWCDRAGNTYNGRYFGDLAAAMRDFFAR